MKRIFFSFFYFFGILFFVEATSVLLRPYKISVFKTDRFDIIFPEKCRKTAEILVENADLLYEKAVKTLNSNVNIRMPIIISPDSDEFSVEYTPHPYNRIIVFEAFPIFNVQDEEQIVLASFYEEIFRAVLQSERSGFNKFIANAIAGGPSYQPVVQLNMPFSFIKGFSLLSNNLDEICSADYFSNDGDTFGNTINFNDAEFLRILIQAKAEKKFPSHFQARIKKDTYPYDKVILAAASGFSAYLMQKYGIEKYIELWQESGKFNIFLTDGIFYNVYEKKLSVLWNEFYEAIPVLPDEANLNELEKNTRELLPNNSSGLYRNLLFSDYGLIWYDSLRHEVDIFNNFNEFDNPFPIRKLLFLANDIENLSLSPDGRFLTVSFMQIKNRQNLKKKVCWIYDLQERKFLSQKFNIEKAALFLSSINTDTNENDSEYLYFAAGINTEEKISKLQVYSFSEEDKNSVLFFEKKFELNEIPISVNFTPQGDLCVLILKDNKQVISFINLKTFEEDFFSLEWKNPDNEENLFNIWNLRTIKTSASKITNNYSDFLYAFDFCLQNEFSFNRTGYITLKDDFKPDSVYFMTDDFFGGMNFACLKDNVIFYSSHKILNDELKVVEKKHINFEQGQIKKIENFYEKADFQKEIATMQEQSTNNLSISNENSISYNPLKYFFPFSVRPMLPIRSISIDDGPELWPGIGITFISQTDPFENTEFMFSAGYAYAKLDFEMGFNTSADYKKNKEKYRLLTKKDKSVALFFKNSSTPVDISYGNIFRFNFDGEYFFQGTVGTSWQIPLGMNFSNMKIKIESDFTASTDYYDSNLIYQNESLKNWPSFSESYELFEASVVTEYSNIHQYGLTPYEKRGFSAGARIYSIWDLNQIRILEKFKEEQTEQIRINGEDYYLTEAQLQESYDERMLAVSQINIGIFARIEIPRLTPLKIINGWVLSVPASVEASLFNETGTALQVKTEILLFGKEIHNGFSFLQLYFGRIGLKTGYELNLKYDTAKVLKPDIRRKNYIGEILANTSLDENFYFLLNIDFTTSIGFSTASMFSVENKFAFYPRHNGFLYSINFVARF